MALTTEDVANLARLARIELSEAELELLAPQLDVMESVCAVSEVAAQDIPPTSHTLPADKRFSRGRAPPIAAARTGTPAHRPRSRCDSGCRGSWGRRHEPAGGCDCRDHPVDGC